jgi:Holliday junction resolvase-like predicted endonuclease
MTDRRRKRTRIEVETRSREERLVAACRYLERVDPSRLERVIALAEAYRASYERPNESHAERSARIAQITRTVGEAN